MFGIGFWELVAILVIALLVVGPERMPELARKVGTTVRDLRRMYDNLRAELGPDFEEVERGIRTLRSMDPRQIETYRRKFMDDLAEEAGPDVKQLLHSSPAQIGDSVKQTLLSDIGPIVPTPAAGTIATDRKPGSSGSAERPEPAPEPPELVEVSEDTRRSDAFSSDPASMQLLQDLLSDPLLDDRLSDATTDASQNGHGPR